MEYKIEVSMNNENGYYFWCILGRDKNKENWHNEGHSWARSRQEAWRNAYSYYDNITLN